MCERDVNLLRARGFLVRGWLCRCGDRLTVRHRLCNAYVRVHGRQTLVECVSTPSRAAAAGDEERAEGRPQGEGGPKSRSRDGSDFYDEKLMASDQLLCMACQASLAPDGVDALVAGPSRLQTTTQKWSC